MMRSKAICSLALAMCLACIAYAEPVEKCILPLASYELSKTIHLVSHGWHAGIVIKRSDIPDHVWPEQKEFGDAEYLEVGWGDRDFYRTPDPHWGLALKAILLPTASVLHIVGFNGTVPAYFPYSEIIELQLHEPGFERLCRYIAASYFKTPAGDNVPLGPGLNGNSKLYLSAETYHLFKTCNVWTAKALRSAGCPVTPASAITIENLMSQAYRFGMVIQSMPPSPDSHAEPEGSSTVPDPRDSRTRP
jgi:uncharacterized protein (TIGR02117 family)